VSRNLRIFRVEPELLGVDYVVAWARVGLGLRGVVDPEKSTGKCSSRVSECVEVVAAFEECDPAAGSRGSYDPLRQRCVVT
jgi:hypothetical protein